MTFAEQLRATPDDPQRNILYGVALAYLGRKDEAIKAGERGLSLDPMFAPLKGNPRFERLMAPQ